MKKVIVVGGGITGIATALYLNSKNFDVSIYEAGNKIGGILKDSTFIRDKFYSSCQYLSANSYWMKLFINEKFKNYLTNFEHTYSSYTDLFNEDILCKSFAMPSSDKNINISLQNIPTKIFNVDERFSIYGNDFKVNLFDFIKKYNNDPLNLHPSFVQAIQLSRIYFRNSTNINKLKNESKVIDELFGLPRSMLNNTKIFSTIPINGYNFFFDQLYKYMNKIGIKIFCNKPIKPVLSNINSYKPVTLYSRREKIDSDLIVWCSNPVPLIKILKFGILDNPFVKTKSIFFSTKNNIKKFEPHYIQVFSKKINITRIYLYSTIDNVNKITVESIDKNIDFNKYKNFTETILNNLNYDLKLKFDNQFENQKRYFLYTLKDYEKFKKTDNLTTNTNIICGGWTKYSRDERIAQIYNQIDNIS